VTLYRDHLAAVAAIWKRQRRQIVARFGGTSMLPSIAPRTELRIDCGRQPAIGDVVLAATEVGLIVHRLIAVRGGHGIMRGDAAAVPDPAVPLGDIFGVAVTKREGTSWVAIPPAPRSLLRLAMQTIAVMALSLGHRVNHRLSGILWRTRGVFAADGSVVMEDDSERDEPKRE
jgi:hypothetical protein